MEEGSTGHAVDAPEPARPFPRWAAATLVITGLALFACTMISPFAFVADDSLFYLVIGRNIADGAGITFSTVMPTNGFQPLWQAVVAAIITIGRPLGLDSDASQLRAALVVCWVLLVVGLVLLAGLLRRMRVRPVAQFGALGAALVLLGGPYGTLATEASLVFATLVASLLVARRLIVEPPERWAPWAVALGAALGVVLLARLDTAFVAAAVLITVLVVLGRARGWVAGLTTTVVAGVATTVVVLPYLVWNQVRFGHLLPISGAVKLDFGTIWLVAESVGRSGWALLAGAVSFGLVALAFRPRRHDVWPWAAITAGAVATSGWYYLFSPGALTRGPWYHAPHIVAFALAAALLADRVLRRAPGLASIATAGIVVGLVGSVAFTATARVQGTNEDQADAVRRFGADAAKVLPEDAIVVTVDYPGYVALNTRRPVIALDGLTGDFAFQDDLVADGGPCTLARLGATHLVTDSLDRLTPVAGGPPGRYQQEITSWLHRESTGFVTVDEDDRLVRNEASGLELWRLDVSCG